jgi:hypothetical protein
MLVDRQAVHLADELPEVGVEPVGKDARDVVDRLAFLTLEAVAARAAAARVVRRRERDALVGRPG